MYLVTGCAGFIGSRVCERLLAAGHRVLGLDNLNDAYDPRLKHWRLDRLRASAGFEFRQADVADRAALPAGPFEAVINLAARAGVPQSVENPWVYHETNVTGTLNLLELCRRAGVRKFVLASTSSLYGKRERGAPFREEEPTDRPLSPYAASKKGAEVLAFTYHHLHGIDVSVLRYFTVYGPAGRPDMSIFRFVKWISEGRPVSVNGDGRQERDFTHVDDVARGTVLALRPTGYEVINLGSHRPVPLLDVVRLIEKETGAVAKVEHGPELSSDVPTTWADIAKARRLLDWEPHVPFEQGIRECVAWYRDNRTWAGQLRE
jgi:nucleoside-diphosphate-sugar epimerase